MYQSYWAAAVSSLCSKVDAEIATPTTIAIVNTFSEYLPKMVIDELKLDKLSRNEDANVRAQQDPLHNVKSTILSKGGIWNIILYWAILAMISRNLIMLIDVQTFLRIRSLVFGSQQNFWKHSQRLTKQRTQYSSLLPFFMERAMTHVQPWDLLNTTMPFRMKKRIKSYFYLKECAMNHLKIQNLSYFLRNSPTGSNPRYDQVNAISVAPLQSCISLS